MSGVPAPPSARTRDRAIIGLVAAAVVVLLAGNGAGLVLVRSTGFRSGPGSGEVKPPSPSTTATTGPAPPTTAALAPGQAVVTGTATSVSAGQATGPALYTPLLVTIPVRGQGSAYIYNATINGRSGQTIFWYGGQPLSIIGQSGSAGSSGAGGAGSSGAGGAGSSGAGGAGSSNGLVPGRINVTVTPGGSTWYLDGAERRIAPGAYEVATPVAVGQSGLATAEPDAFFTATTDTVMVTTGGANLSRSPMPLHLIGPGAVQIQGQLSIRTDRGTTTATEVTMSSGQYVLDITPGSSAVTVTATLQGKLALG